MSVPALILHHFEASPFSEKFRLVLGMKGLSWQSVLVPRILPKPDVVALTGGYRRTPFLQIGADIYCDTALMCRVVDRLHPTPPLYPKLCSAQQHVLSQWADTQLFWTAVPYTMQPAGSAFVFRGAPAGAIEAFAADRAAMTPGMRRPTPADAKAQLDSYFGWLDTLLSDGRGFLCGAQPCIADFSVVQSVWYIVRVPPVAAVLEPYGRLMEWYQRVVGFGHGTRSGELDGEAAIAIAADASRAGAYATTEVAADSGFALGAAVDVCATDYASDVVRGTLAGLTPDEIVVERADARAGTVHVHFPRIGFQVKATAAG